MYQLILRKNYSDIYDIYKDNNKIRDEYDITLKIDEKNKKVAFFNAYKAHNLLDVDIILNELIDLLLIIDNTNKWQILDGYDYFINRELETKLNNI